MSKTNSKAIDVSKSGHIATAFPTIFSVSRLTFVVATFLAALAGVANVTIIPLVLFFTKEGAKAKFETWLQGQFAWFDMSLTGNMLVSGFFLFCVMIILLRSFSHIMLANLAIGYTLELRKYIYNRISAAKTEDMESVGPSRVITALNYDVNNIVTGAEELPGLIVTVTTIIGLLIYLAYIDVMICLLVLALIIFGLITSRMPFGFAKKRMEKSRHVMDQLQESVRGLLYGHKELKLNAKGRMSYLQRELEEPELEVKARSMQAQAIMITAMNYGSMISFFVIGFFTFKATELFTITPEQVTAVIMVMLYISAPLAKLVGLFRPIANARISLTKIHLLLNSLPEEKPIGQLFATIPEVPKFNQITFKGINYSYPRKADSDSHFSINDIELNLVRGEVAFIVGGNGSGKTTLAKLISLHYLAGSGEILFDDQALNAQNIETYRQSIAVIYADYYLFERVHIAADFDVQGRVEQLLKQLSLDKKVTFKDGQFSSLSLSSGQRRRLALLVNSLEDRDVFIFDEWAADQDPLYRDVFYQKILPDLKQRNKLIVVISHDDRYFDLADKLIVMDSGKIREIKDNTNARNCINDNANNLLEPTY